MVVILENLFKSTFTIVETELFTLNILPSVYYKSDQNNSKQWIKTPIVDYLFTIGIAS